MAGLLSKIGKGKLGKKSAQPSKPRSTGDHLRDPLAKSAKIGASTRTGASGVPSQKSEKSELTPVQAVTNQVQETAQTMDIPPELLALVVETENNKAGPDEVRTNGQDAKNSLESLMAWTTFSGKDAPEKDPGMLESIGNRSLGLTNVKPSTAVTTMNRLETQDEINGTSYAEQLGQLETQSDVISSLTKDETNLLFAAGGLRSWLELNRQNGIEIAGSPVPEDLTELTEEQVIFALKYHNDPGWKPDSEGDEHWAQSMGRDILEGGDLKFMP